MAFIPAIYGDLGDGLLLSLLLFVLLLLLLLWVGFQPFPNGRFLIGLHDGK